MQISGDNEALHQDDIAELQQIEINLGKKISNAIDTPVLMGASSNLASFKVSNISGIDDLKKS